MITKPLPGETSNLGKKATNITHELASKSLTPPLKRLGLGEINLVITEDGSTKFVLSNPQIFVPEVLSLEEFEPSVVTLAEEGGIFGTLSCAKVNSLRGNSIKLVLLPEPQIIIPKVSSKLIQVLEAENENLTLLRSSSKLLVPDGEAERSRLLLPPYLQQG